MSWLSIFQGCPLGSTVLLDMVHVNMKWLAALKWGAKNNSRCPLLHSLPIPSFLIFVAMCKCMTVVTGTAVPYCAPWGHPKCSSVNRLESNTSNCIGQHSDAPCTDEKKNSRPTVEWPRVIHDTIERLLHCPFGSHGVQMLVKCSVHLVTWLNQCQSSLRGVH